MAKHNVAKRGDRVANIPGIGRLSLGYWGYDVEDNEYNLNFFFVPENPSWNSKGQYLSIEDDFTAAVLEDFNDEDADEEVVEVSQLSFSDTFVRRLERLRLLITPHRLNKVTFVTTKKDGTYIRISLHGQLTLPAEGKEIFDSVVSCLSNG